MQNQDPLCLLFSASSADAPVTIHPALATTAVASGDREEIALYTHSDSTGYILCTEQLPGDSAYHLFRREGDPGSPHDHSSRLKILRGGADDTDGLEATSTPLGKSFPGGLVIAMNSGPRNYLVFRWEEFATVGEPKLSPPHRQRASSRPGVSDF